jgi:hypothetical protein
MAGGTSQQERSAILTVSRPRCRICGRRLRVPPHMYWGIGPVCIKRWRTEAAYRERVIVKRIDPYYPNDPAARQAAIDELDAQIARAFAATS